MMDGRITVSVVALLSLGVLGCAGAGARTGAAEEPRAGGEPEAVEPSSEMKASAAALIEVTGPDQPWAEMPEYDREMYMVGKVMPIMHELFYKHDPGRYSSFQCETCHGNDMKETHFAMPAASIYALPEPGSRAWENMEKSSPDLVRFMKEEVTPTMGKLLGIEDYTCTNCHPPR